MASSPVISPAHKLSSVLDIVFELVANLFFGWVPDRTWARVLVALIYVALVAFGIYLAATGFSP